MAEFLRTFGEVARARGDATAIVARDQTLSFAALRAEGERLACELRAAGVREGDVVALSLGRTSAHVIGMIGAWYAGAAFLPLDPSAPPDRVRAALRESRARVLLTRDQGRMTIQRLSGDLDPLGAVGPEEDALAYVIYTSGSTGRPKGVRIAHRGLVPLLRAQIRAFGLAPGKRALLYVSTTFDASISDIGTALLSGATLVIAEEPPAPASLAERLRADGITHADLPPSILPRVDPASLPATLETVVIGGEVCPAHVVRAWARQVRVINVYGPTEATICTSLCACDKDEWKRPLIGSPLPHVAYAIEEGELLIAGPALALGYVDRPELEAQRFVERSGTRWYRTGDLVRAHDDGELEFLGRTDRQIKVHGQLVCPEEIEARLRAIDDVAEAMVGAESSDAPDAPLRAKLIATVVLAPESTLSPAILRRRLEETLPRWMIPRIVFARELGRGSSGKIEPERRPAVLAPRASSPRVRAIQIAFEEALGVASVGEDDDFVELGGDSLAALEIAALAQLSGIAIEAATVLAERAPAAIARAPGPEMRTVARLEKVADRVASELGPPRFGANGQERGRAEEWLLTGATGFLGRRLLPALLARTEARVHCIVRAANEAEARSRLGSLGEDNRLVAHAGDVSAPRLGLGAAAWHDLTRRVGHVVHAAASLSLALPFEALEATNVRGALEVARFVIEGEPKVLHHVSSLAVLASTDLVADRLDERTRASADTRVIGPYAQTKWIAEALFRRTVPELQILRPGLLTADSVTAVSAAGCPLSSFLRAASSLGCLPVADDEFLRVDITPVDQAACAIARIVTSPRPVRELPIVHIASERGASLADLVRALRKHTPIDRTTRDDFLARARDRLTRDAALALVASSFRLLGTEAQRGADLFLHTGRWFPRPSGEELYGSFPALDLGDLLSRYVAAVCAAAPGQGVPA